MTKFQFIVLVFRCVVGTGVLDGPLPQFVFVDRPGGRSLQGLYDKLNTYIKRVGCEITIDSWIWGAFPPLDDIIIPHKSGYFVAKIPIFPVLHILRQNHLLYLDFEKFLVCLGRYIGHKNPRFRRFVAHKKVIM